MKRSCSALMAIIFVIITLFHAVSCKWTPSYEFKDGALTINGQKGMDDWANDCRKEEGETQTFQIKSEMKELILKGDVLIVPTKAFADCFLLEQVTMSDSINAIEDHAFDNDKSLKHIDWSQGLLSIGKYAFRRTAVETIAFPEGLLSINNFAFWGLPYLTEVILPDSLVKMDYAFSNCPKLEKIQIGSGISYLGDFEFSECESLRTLFVPKNITEIKERPLEGSGIERLIFEGTVEKITKFEITEDKYPSLRQVVFLDAPPTKTQHNMEAFLIDNHNITVFVLNEKLRLFYSEYEEEWGGVSIIGISSMDDIPALS